MRVSKDNGTDSSRFYYDGQMPMETLDTTSSGSTVTQNGLGARGIDRIERVNSSGTTVGYPLYDGHGNMVATLAKAGTSYSLGDQRAYDAWGVTRQGATSGDPKGRYCANLGHVEDDESGLTYMRARYYEPELGRFLTQDPKRQGQNYYSYCGSNPVDRTDKTGEYWDWETSPLQVVALLVGSKCFFDMLAKGKEGGIAAAVVGSMITFMMIWYGGNVDENFRNPSKAGSGTAVSALMTLLYGSLAAVTGAALSGGGSPKQCSAAVAGYLYGLATLIALEASGLLAG